MAGAKKGTYLEVAEELEDLADELADIAECVAEDGEDFGDRRADLADELVGIALMIDPTLKERLAKLG